MQKHWYNIPMDEKNNLDNLLNNKQKFENTFPKVDLNNSIPIDTGTVDSLLDAPIANNQMVNEEVMDEIKTLDTASLKKDVLETQIEIQKSLLESEKVYREGITTIKDLIAPAGVNVKTSMLEIGTKLSRSFFILVYPRVISSGWLEGVVNVDIPLDLSVYIYPKDSSEVLKELKRKVGRIQATLFDNQERGQARDPALETAYQDVEFLRDQIQQGVERFFQVGVYITVYADNLDQLEKYSQTVEAILAQQSIIMKRAALQMGEGFNSTLPIMKDSLKVLTNLNTSPLSACFPFVSADLSSNNGILYGINRHNSSLVIFDRFDLENANSLVFATSGSGKSYAVKLEILRSLMMGVSVIVVDPEAEYKNLSDTLGGAYINMSLNSDNRINPFDLPKALPGENKADILRTAIIDLLGLLSLMVGKMTVEETSVMEKAISETYSRRDITAASDFNTVQSPTMSDLVEILNGIEGGEALAQKLYRYTDGTFAGIFNQRTNININNSLVVYNIRDLQESLRPIAMYILLKHVWNEIRSELKKRILTIDEAWIMMQYEDSAKFLLGLVKRARKYYLGVTCITQDVGDFLQSPYGKPIVNNSALKLLLKQSPSTIDLIGDVFALTSGEKQILVNSGVGEGIFFAGPRHVALQVLAFPTEHSIITTNPKDLMRQKEEGEAKAAQ
jgi:conjugal transfer ATP-binding protein TraC